MTILDIHQTMVEYLWWFDLIKTSPARANRLSKERLYASRGKKSLTRSLSDTCDSLRMWQSISKSTMVRHEYPTCTSGNTLIYSTILDLMDVTSDSENNVREELVTASQFQKIRSGIMVESSIVTDRSKDFEMLCRLDAHREDLFHALGVSSNNLEGKISSDSEKPITVQIGKKKSIEITNLGKMVNIKIENVSRLFLRFHFDRLLDSLGSFRNYLATTHYLDPGIGVKILSKVCRLGMTYPEAIGEYIKAARNVIAADISRDTLLGKSSGSMLQDTYEGRKYSMCDKLVDFFSSLTDDVNTMYLASHIYKYIPHPDTDIESAFKKTEGVREPNRTEPGAMPKLAGVIKKSLFMASVKNGEPLRIAQGDSALKTESEKSNPNYNTMSAEPYHRWSDIVFEKSNIHSEYLNIDLKVVDKSHCTMKHPGRLEMKRSYTLGYMIGLEEELPPSGSLFQSDYVAKYKHGIDPTSTECKIEVDEMFNKHLAFEEDMIRQANDPKFGIDDITPEDIENFRRTNPDAFYVVATEAKAGEKHKELTRMFYLANLHVKRYLSLIERLVKRLTRGQTGNSITKSYKGRLSDLQNFAHGVCAPGGRYTPVYVSFDMTEFSKKFPGSSLRVMGNILADITGDETLRRLDLFFRAATVAHSTRGYSSEFSGVLGGFEGFMNFIWTTIHVAVMELALSNAGVIGSVLAYSDDGLLYFLIDGDPLEKGSLAAENVRKIVLGIRDTYLKLGLVFHMGKTLASTTTFEYLGDISDNGHLLDTYVKPAAALGLIDPSVKVTTVGTYIQTIIGQLRSVVSAGAPPMFYEHIALVSCVRKIRRIRPSISFIQAAVILATPISCSGWSFPDPVTLCLVTDRDSGREFYADMANLYLFYPVEVGTILGNIMDNIATGSKMKSKSIMGSSISTDLPDSSGTSVLIKAANKVRSKNGDAELEHPLTDRIVDSIVNLLSYCGGITHQVISSIIKETPDMVEYDRLISEGKSTGATKILKREELREFQASDHRSVKEVLNILTRNNPGRKPSDLLVMLTRLSLECNLDPPKPSSRECFNVDDNRDCSVTAILDLRNHGNIGLGGKVARTCHNLSFIQPDMGSFAVKDNIGFEAEHSKDNQIPYKLMSAVARIERSCQGAGFVMSSVCRLMGITIPNFQTTSNLEVNRLRALKGSQEVHLNMPYVLVARTKVLDNAKMVTRKCELTSSHRDLPQYVALAHVNLIAGYKGLLSMAPQRSALMHKFPVSRVDEWLMNPKIHLKRDIDEAIFSSVRKVWAPTEDQSIAAINKFNADNAEELALAKMITLDEGDLEFSEMLIAEIAERIVRRIMYLSADVAVTSSLVNLSCDTKTVSINLLIRNLVIMKLMGRMIQRNLDYEGSLEEVKNIIDSVKDHLPSAYSCELIENMVTEAEFMDYMRRTNAVNTLFGSKGVIVINNGNVHGDSAMNRARVKILRETICSIYTTAKEQGVKFYSTRTAISDSGSSLILNETGVAIDTLLDVLSIAVSATRDSSHRVTPWNQHSYTLEAYKFLCIYRRLLSNLFGHRELSWSWIPGSGSGITRRGKFIYHGDERYADGIRKIANNVLSYMTPRLTRGEEAIARSRLGNRPDLQKLVTQPLQPSAVSRMITNCIWGSGGDYSGFDLERMWTEGSLLQCVAKNYIADIMSRKIVGVRKAHLPKNLDTLDVYSDMLPESRFPGYESSDLDVGEQPKSTNNLIWAHVATVAFAEGIGTFELTEGLPLNILNEKPEIISLSNQGLKIHYRNNLGSGVVIVQEKYHTIGRAFAAQVDLSAAFPTSVTVYPHDNHYIMVGAYINLTDNFITELPEKWEIENTTLLKSLIPSDLTVYTRYLMGKAGCHISTTLNNSGRITAIEVPGITTKTISHTARMIEGRPMLVASSILSSRASLGWQQYWAYCLLQADIVDGDIMTAVNEFRETISEFRIASTNGNRRQVAMCMRGISAAGASVVSYFKSNPLTQPIEEPSIAGLFTVPLDLELDIPDFLDMVPLYRLSFERMPRLDDIINRSRGNRADNYLDYISDI